MSYRRQCSSSSSSSSSSYSSSISSSSSGSSKLKLLSWNARSLKQGCSAVSDYIERENPDVVCVQEARHGHDFCEIEGYNKHVHETDQGLVTYVNEELRYKQIKTSPLYNNNGGNTYMDFQVYKGDKPIYISNTYIEGEQFDERKFRHLTKYEDIILAGDFNARHPNFPGSVNDNNNWNGRRLVEFVENQDLYDPGPERPTHSKGGRLDYILYGGLEEASFRPARLLDLGSDHYALESTMHFY